MKTTLAEDMLQFKRSVVMLCQVISEAVLARDFLWWLAAAVILLASVAILTR